MLLLNTEALAGGYEERLTEVQEMLSHRRGLTMRQLTVCKGSRGVAVRRRCSAWCVSLHSSRGTKFENFHATTSFMLLALMNGSAVAQTARYARPMWKEVYASSS